jgi:protein O-mannosyl-transferase
MFVVPPLGGESDRVRPILHTVLPPKGGTTNDFATLLADYGGLLRCLPLLDTLRQDGGNSMSKRRKQTSTAQPSAETRCAPVAVCLFLAVTVAVVFGQTVNHDFVNFDDQDYVYENPHVVRGLTSEGVAWALTTAHASNWHPLTWLSHELDCQLYGLQAGGHHATNVLLHAANAILLFLLLWRMTGDFWPAAFVATVFAVHPLRVESVAWLAERKDVLSGFFFMLTLAAYLNYVRRPFSLGRYSTVLVVFVMGLMAKPMLVTVPFVLLLLDYWPLGRLARPGSENRGFSVSWRVIVEKIPLLLLTVASCAITAWAQADAIMPWDRLPLASRLANAVVSYISYLGQLFWPVDLAVFYPHPGGGLPGSKVVVSLILLLGLSLAALVCRRRVPCLTVGWLWYLGMLVPVIGLVQAGSHAHADRYTYLPQIGLLIALAWGVTLVARSWPSSARVFAVASSLAVAVLMGCAYHQTTFWLNSQTLWERALDCTSCNAVAHTNLGAVLTNLNQYDKAVSHLRQALDIEPSCLDAHVDLGEVLAKMNQFDAARVQYREAIRIAPNCVEARYNLALAWARQGRLDEAIPEYEATLRIDSGCAEAHANLGVALQLRGRIEEAMMHFERAFELATRQNKKQLAEDLEVRLRQTPERRVDSGPQ